MIPTASDQPLRQSSADPRFKAVDDYALQRMRERGDVYAWAPSGEGRLSAILFISRAAATDSFPSRLGQVVIKVRAIDEPVLQADSNGGAL